MGYYEQAERIIRKTFGTLEGHDELITDIVHALDKFHLDGYDQGRREQVREKQIRKQYPQRK